MRSTSPVFRYLFAVAATAAALSARLALTTALGDRIPYATFYAATTLTAIYGGLGPGILAAVLGAMAVAWFLLPPYQRFPVSLDLQVGMLLYLCVSAALLLMSEMQRRTRARAETNARIAEERRREAEEQSSLREQAEAAERLLRQRYEVTLASIGDGVIATDTEGRVTFTNGVAAAMTGWPAGEAIGQPVEVVFQVRNEESGAMVENPVARAAREGRVIGLANHTELLSRDGKRIAIDDSGAPILDREGKLIGAILVFRDVSETKAREEELRNLSCMIEMSHDAVILTDARRRITTWNTGAREIYGWTREEAIGKVIHHLLQTRNTKAMQEIDATLAEHGRWDGELIHTSKSGQEIVCESRHVLVRKGSGEVTGILEINRDITERRHAEHELRTAMAQAEEGHRTLVALMEHIPEGIAIADATDCALRMVSRHGAELVERTPESLVGVRAHEQPAALGVYYPDARTPARAQDMPLARAVTAGEITADEEWVIRRPDGTSIFVNCNAAPIRDAAGNVTGGLLAWRDATQRKRLEEKLRESAKLESLGVLAGGIAHDFNNILTGVLGNASLLLEEVPPGTQEWSFARGILTAAERAAKLTQQMLAYSGRGRFVVERVDLSKYIEETTEIIQTSLPKNVELHLNLAHGLPLIEADLAQIQQVVMNLVINAGEAIGPEGGRISVVTREEQIDEDYIQSLMDRGNVSPGRYVILEVQDTGCGMDERTIARIFDPFFTTKFTGRGLGLAAVQGIVHGHKGAIKIYSTPGTGTTFRVFLPANAAESEPPPKAVVGEAEHKFAGTVMVVDDEEVVRSTARAALETLGFGVITASDGHEAVEVFRAMSGSISLVLLDMTMPGISGEETLRQLRRIRSDVRVILSSGFSEMEARRRFDGYRLAGFLQKPYTVGTLRARIEMAATAL